MVNSFTTCLLWLHCLHRLDIGDIMVSKSELLLPWNLGAKAYLRIPAGSVLETLHDPKWLFFPISFLQRFRILAKAYIALSGTLLNVLDVMSHLILLTVL